MKIWYVPIEPLESRYTQQYYKWFPMEWKKAGIDYEVIDGEILNKEITHGYWLDFCGTNYYKASQIMKISKLFNEGKIKDNDCFFVLDLWFPGLEAIPYMSQFLKIKTQIWGLFHAGTYDPTDATVLQAHMQDWGEHIERGWCKFITGAFVGTEYHKKLLLDGKRIDENKVHVPGFPFYPDEVMQMALSVGELPEREKIVVFPHRFDREKNPHTFMCLAEILSDLDKDIKFMVTTPRKELVSSDQWIIDDFHKTKKKLGDRLLLKTGMTKAEYYHTLSGCSVIYSSASQENFGYGILEGITMGCTPVCIKGKAYLETLQNDDRFLFEDLDRAGKMILEYCENPINVSHYAKQYEQAIPNMIKIMEKWQ